ncbi:MAG: ribulose-phosphate 3-epimerase [Bacteroides sp.]|nr:ribulose-phosphate 3-epimerase [Eubacterium sp.]MCM1418790.1 ribulose-phosphate 3-epimerase [Roseburia sp.]MCM1462447.1 ribulose-phosphate 3-epimerase [Bacteroides sp.]
MSSVQISASVLNSDLSALGETAKRIAESGIEYLHFDVMDGEFVENITFGSAVQAAVARKAPVAVDTHLMVRRPARQIPLFAEAGSRIISFHLESEGDPAETAALIRSYGVRAGIALKPATPAEAVFPYLNKIDLVLIMTVEPGYGGQGFLPETVEKIRAVRAEAERIGKGLDLEVDGGINQKTAPLVRAAGANILVAGTYLIRSADMRATAETLRR